MWYNNDGSLAFPRLLAVAVEEGFPAQLAEAVTIATDVMGASSGYGSLQFGEAVTSPSGGIFVVFELPSHREQTGVGAGGGPAIGYRMDGGGLAGWLSPNGEDWVRMHPDYRLAIEPLFAAASEQSAKSLRSVLTPSPDSVSQQTALLPASPNPFNPTTKLGFTLREPGEASLSVYNVRGELVVQLAAGRFESGPHSVEWNGQDTHGRPSSSGVYFARLCAGGIVMTEELVLVR
jgi:hypothetical protein